MRGALDRHQWRLLRLLGRDVGVLERVFLLVRGYGGVLASVDSATTFRGIFEYIKQFGTLKSQVLSDRCNNSVSCGAYYSFIPPTS